MDARHGYLVGDVCDRRCRNWSILAAFSPGVLSRRVGVPSLRDGAQASRESGAPISLPDLRTGARDYTVESSRSGNVGCPAGLASTSPSPSLLGHQPVLDGLRGLAVLMVLVFHFVGQMLPTNWVERTIVGVTKYGLLGVDLFFVLSGFLITGILYDACNKPHYFRNFYMRRLLRIFPLYYGVLALIFFVAPLIPLLRGPTLDYLLDRQAWAWLYGVNIYLANTRGVVLLLPQSLLVALRRGALLPLLAAGSLPAGAPAAGAHCSELGDLTVRYAGPPDRVASGGKLVGHHRADPLQARRLGAGRLPGSDGAPARGLGVARAGPATGRGRRRRAAGGHLRLDRSGFAPGAGAGGVGPDSAVPGAAGLSAGMGPDCPEGVGHLTFLLQPLHGLPGHL